MSSRKHVLADLFRLTPMQSTFSISLLALVDGEPRVLTLKQALRVYLEHRLEMVRRRSEYDLEKARNRAHILEGLLIALDNLDAVIDTIRRSRTVETAKANLRKSFKLSEMQAQAILDMQLRRLAALERKKIQDEHKEKLQLIKYLERLLSKPELMRDTIKEELLAVREKYADTRRTQIVDTSQSKVMTESDLLPDEQVWVLLGEKGTIGPDDFAGDDQYPAETGGAAAGAVGGEYAGYFVFVCGGRPFRFFTGLSTAAGAGDGSGDALGGIDRRCRGGIMWWRLWYGRQPSLMAIYS